MVWIHGGGFVTGDGSDKMYGPKYLLDKDVILVTLNYRLGPLGSLNLDTDQAPGSFVEYRVRACPCRSISL